MVDPIAFGQLSGHIVSLNHICHLQYKHDLQRSGLQPIAFCQKFQGTGTSYLYDGVIRQVVTLEVKIGMELASYTI
nr:hypothetical protein CFP56_50612 [Quercus suber]